MSYPKSRYDKPLAPFAKNSDTSHDAAASLTANYLATKQRAVYNVIRAAGLNGVTLEEIESATDMTNNRVNPRLIELRRGENPLVVDSGRTRKTRSGRNATVWVAASFVEDAGQP